MSSGLTNLRPLQPLHLRPTPPGGEIVRDVLVLTRDMLKTTELSCHWSDHTVSVLMVEKPSVCLLIRRFDMRTRPCLSQWIVGMLVSLLNASCRRTAHNKNVCISCYFDVHDKLYIPMSLNQTESSPKQCVITMHWNADASMRLMSSHIIT